MEHALLEMAPHDSKKASLDNRKYLPFAEKNCDKHRDGDDVAMVAKSFHE